MTEITLDPPANFSAFELAEWIEFHLLLNGLESISRSSIMQKFPAGQSPDAAEMDQLFSEIRRRSILCESLYPYREVDESIAVDSEIDGRVYQLLLILSLRSAPFRLENRYNEINPAFELITREALISNLGDRARAVRFGWPSDDGRPERLDAAVTWLAKELGLSEGNTSGDIDSSDKDGGIDVVGWKPFSDGAPAFPVWLVQCTVQATYERKPSDVKPEKWMAWIKFGKPPGIALSIPYAIPPDAKIWGTLRWSAGLILDRLRLCEDLRTTDALLSHREHDELPAWIVLEIAKIRAALLSSTGITPRMAKRRQALRR
ncbi:hypothetical protein [Rathayibacter sp. AY1E8]|uniref:hypothetical protein n=1 Tax=Rathayibacter sp. AY1E8 TaxID=2080555 RepID=UPI0011B0B7C3|nr:hypothetical protein [Rathayibacter sp. AY1E8]